ncbi:chemotaxis-specific protein-glutamate methyltransferase CheB [Kolteria novifilia]|uniref:chemotaxis-specific protein-glutamate methyltransferase CheB n=1 Tax=Kolteria novifilia TaxID=2527975 RepID=UPI003AF3FFE9
MTSPLRLLIVDDSRIFREAFREIVAPLPGVEVVGSVWNGVKALEYLRANPVDLVTLDLQMPQMDGLETLRAIQRLNGSRPDDPPVGVLLVSAYSRQGAEVTIKALEAGAFDFVCKPSGPHGVTDIDRIRRSVSEKLRAYASQRDVGTVSAQVPAPIAAPPIAHRFDREIEGIFIAVSTGGPQALTFLLPELSRVTRAPIFVAQHLPAEFTPFLAKSLDAKCPARVVVASDDEPVEAGTIYIAPGGRNLLLRKRQGMIRTGINDLPSESGCRPSADILFRSAAPVLGQNAVACVLTGMGHDGTEGLRALRRAGAYVLAQDEESSVVWGMPGSAVAAGLVDRVVPISEIAEVISALAHHPGAS